ncbi:MAG: hypothetical protein BWY31_01709 [Lentisphaerae bacterium ADurb.Bin242]|nr:MAG: hypothetical protein BWY31_01709 [Lentisphaerae bacterium ADurb.Bin242]
MSIYVAGFSSLMTARTGDGGASCLAAVRKEFQLRRIDRFTLLALASAAGAAEDFSGKRELPGDTGILLASSFGPARIILEYVYDMLDYPPDQMVPGKFSHSVHNAAASYVANCLKTCGPEISLAGFAGLRREAWSAADTWLRCAYCPRVLLIFVEELIPFTAFSNEKGYTRIEDGSAAFLLTSSEEENRYGEVFCDSSADNTDAVLERLMQNRT